MRFRLDLCDVDFQFKINRLRESKTAEEWDDNWCDVELFIQSDYIHYECFVCKIKSGELVLKEHEDAKWLTKETLDSVEWLPADIALSDQIREYL